MRFTILLITFIFQYVSAKLNESDYYKLPRLYDMDDYELCEIKGKTYQYCIFEINLIPISTNTRDSVLWNLIQENNADKSKYRRDILEMGRCILIGNETDSQFHENLFKSKFEKDELNVVIKKVLCKQFEPKHFDYLDIVAIVILVLIFISVIAATITDYYKSTKTENTSDYKEGSFALKCLLCWSLKKNLISHPITSIPLNGNVIIQSFFLFSSFVLSISVFKQMEKNEFRIGFIFTTIFHRYLRLTPIYALLILINATLVVHVSNGGPYWHQRVELHKDNCRNGWWQLTYINYRNVFPQKFCMPQTWYLIADTQLYCVTVLVLSLIWLMKRQIKYILSICLLITILIPGFITYRENLGPMIVNNPQSMREFFYQDRAMMSTYVQSYTNASGTIYGIICGYIYHTGALKSNLLKKLWFRHIWFWLVFLNVYGFMFFCSIMNHSNLTNLQSNQSFAVVWAAINKLLFVNGTALFVWGLRQQTHSIMRKVLEYRPIIVFGRLSFCNYLVHYQMYMVQDAMNYLPRHYNIYTFIVSITSKITIAYIFGFLLCMFVEYPLTNLFRLVIRKSPNPVNEVPLQENGVNRNKLPPSTALEKKGSSDVLV
ncbi:uncharacterized protein LOC123301228 [Chrysoperla carnea]|uniref:uncharacterized protein LOC123301228 n=1 Tax=Chrysoperla carnea TaxID=189513 RepID=UPI001D06F582|nr:uncharacterized protein LOC123301228 [Chrysoperla carnea]